MFTRIFEELISVSTKVEMLKSLHESFMKMNTTFSYQEKADNFVTAFENGPKN